MQTLLTDREAEIMDVLWDHGPSTVAEVRTQLPDKPAYTTVLTILRILEAKSFIDHAEEGRAHRYAARVGREAARRSALQALSKKFFNGSAALLLTHLVSEQKLSREDVRRIRALLDRQAPKDKS
jgi:predicted transcriptional regulator